MDCEIFPSPCRWQTSQRQLVAPQEWRGQKTAAGQCGLSAEGLSRSLRLGAAAVRDPASAVMQQCGGLHAQGIAWEGLRTADAVSNWRAQQTAAHHNAEPPARSMNSGKARDLSPDTRQDADARLCICPKKGPGGFAHSMQILDRVSVQSGQSEDRTSLYAMSMCDAGLGE